MIDSGHQTDLLGEAVKVLEKQYEENKDFNSFFDEEGPLYLGEYEYERSRTLFWLDREAYENERRVWEDNSYQELHKEIIDLISNSGLVAPFQDLLAAVERGRVVPFVGAGMSRPMGMPLWAEALEKLVERIPGADKVKILKLIEEGRYLDAAQYLYECDAVQVKNFIRTAYRRNKLNPSESMRLLPRIGNGCVITTNFDDAIEQTYHLEGMEFRAYMHGTQEHNFFPRLARGERCLLKLHGDADDPATHILTQEQYADAYGSPFDFKKPLPKALRQVFISQSLLFLGCSLEQDWTLELLENSIATEEYVVPNHYAIIPEVANAQEKAIKETRLLALNIQPLWYPNDRHEYVERYLKLLVDAAEKRVSFAG